MEHNKNVRIEDNESSDMDEDNDEDTLNLEERSLFVRVSDAHKMLTEIIDTKMN